QFLDAGVAVAGIDVGECYGSPEGRKYFSAFYKEVTAKRHFGAKACLLGITPCHNRSRTSGKTAAPQGFAAAAAKGRLSAIGAG
ncbi:MAG: hypothetical protein QF662_05290, partial [Phycisphaerae bacterium]|nr:hypothetical protein [Phycisphaerae bacterium]